MAATYDRALAQMACTIASGLVQQQRRYTPEGLAEHAVEIAQYVLARCVRLQRQARLAAELGVQAAVAAEDEGA